MYLTVKRRLKLDRKSLLWTTIFQRVSWRRKLSKQFNNSYLFIYKWCTNLFSEECKRSSKDRTSGTIVMSYNMNNNRVVPPSKGYLHLLHSTIGWTPLLLLYLQRRKLNCWEGFDTEKVWSIFIYIYIPLGMSLAIMKTQTMGTS